MDRYSRQILLSQIGEEGQKRLKKSKVAIIGCGALGTGMAERIARAGIGDILLVDRDIIELSNLQRQHLFTEHDVGELKAVIAETKLHALNTEIAIKGTVDDVNSSNVQKFIKGRDIILDGTDNLNVRFIINDACNKLKIPWIYGACVAVTGMTMVILPEGPCLRCLIPQMPSPGSIPSCDTVGIINTLPTVISSLQTTEAIKYLIGEPVDSDLLMVDVWEKEFRKIIIPQRKDCPCCIRHTYEFLAAPDMTVLVGRDAVQINLLHPVSLEELEKKLIPHGTVKKTLYNLFFSTDQYTLNIFPDGRALIKGTNDVNEAKDIYERYIGLDD